MKKLSAAQKEITAGLRRAAADYLNLGVERFLAHHQKTPMPYFAPQFTAGVLAIAVELMLKLAIAETAFAALYTTASSDLRLALTYPTSAPTDNDTDARLAFELLSPLKTVELNEAISIAYFVVPDLRRDLQGYLRRLADVRNKCVHYVLPATESYSVDRTAYLALRLSELLRKHGRFNWAVGVDDTVKAATAFVTAFDAERVERVQKALEAAKKRLPQATGTNWISLSGRDSNTWATACPVCGSDGMLQGDTERSWNEQREIDETFYADAFECTDCGLILADSEELRLAGMDIAFQVDPEEEPDSRR